MNEAATIAGKWIDWGFNSLAALFFCATLYLIWQNARNIKDAKAGNTAVAALLAVFCALMGNPDRFQTFKFSFTGIEASARQAIQQVEVTVQQLRNLAAAFAEASLQELVMSGQIFHGMSTRTKFELHDKIIDNLKHIGIRDDEIANLQSSWSFEYLRITLDIIEEVASKLLSDLKAEAEIDALPKTERRVPSPETVKSWITTHSLQDPTLSELVDEYQRIWTTGSMKNPDLIRSRTETKIR
jgi:hypothetical protein